MLHTKFRENWPAYSGDEIFFKVFTIYGHGGHLDQHHIKIFHFHVPKSSHTKFGSKWPSGF